MTPEASSPPSGRVAAAGRLLARLRRVLQTPVEPRRWLAMADPRLLAWLILLVLLLVAVTGLLLAWQDARQAQADVADLRTRLAAVMARPIPHRPPPPPDGGSDVRLFPGSGEGAASAAMQGHVARLVDAAGLRLQRITVEPGSGDPTALTLRIEAVGGLDAVQTALFRIESSVPYLVVTQIDIQRPEAADTDRLELSAVIRGRWKAQQP